MLPDDVSQDDRSQEWPIAINAAEAPARTKPSNYPEPFASQMVGREKRPLGDLFGLKNFGVNLTRLVPQAVSALRHAHTKQDEFIYILQGYPTLYTDEGRTALSPGMCAGFKAGTGNGHQLVNETTEDVVYLEVGDRTPGDEGCYPDDDLQALLEDGQWKFLHKDGQPYMDKMNPLRSDEPQTIEWPKKTRELCNHHFDSTIWNDFSFRDDDIIIATYAKSGTTWMQQIIGQLLFDAHPDIEVADISPWLDLRVPPKEVKLPLVEMQTHRRFLKTHLPVDALHFSPKAKYIYIGRDGRDVVWSLHNHHANANQLWYEALNDTPGRVGPPIEPPPADVKQYWQDWMAGDGYPFWSFWENVRSWWQIRHLPNVMLVHFADLKSDLPGQIRDIAAFLEIPIDESHWQEMVEHCSFDWMKQNATKTVPAGGIFWDAGAEIFIHRGVNGRWIDRLTPEECVEYEARAEAELGADCAKWLANGTGILTEN